MVGCRQLHAGQTTRNGRAVNSNLTEHRRLASVATRGAYLYATTGVLVLVAIAGLTRHVVTSGGWRALPRRVRDTLLLLLVVHSVVPFELFLVGWGKPYTRHHWGVTHARYLFPVLGISSLQVMGGLAALPPRKWRPVLPALVLCGMLILNASSSFYRTWDASGPLCNELAAGQATCRRSEAGSAEVVSFASDTSLLEQSIAPAGPGAGDTVRVQMVWRADADLRKDYRAYVHILNTQGEAVAKDDVVPTGYRFPTRLWRQGDVILDDRHMSLPGDVAPGRYAVEMGVYEFDAENRIVLIQPSESGVAQASPRQILGYVQVGQPPLTMAQIPMSREADFGGEMERCSLARKVAGRTIQHCRGRLQAAGDAKASVYGGDRRDG